MLSWQSTHYQSSPVKSQEKEAKLLGSRQAEMAKGERLPEL
jgi:hypothetical protein